MYPIFIVHQFSIDHWIIMCGIINLHFIRWINNFIRFSYFSSPLRLVRFDSPILSSTQPFVHSIFVHILQFIWIRIEWPNIWIVYVPFARLNAEKKFCLHQKKKKKENKISIVFIRLAERTDLKGKRDEKRLKTDQIKIHLYTIWASDLDAEHRTPFNFEIAAKLLHLWNSGERARKHTRNVRETWKIKTSSTQSHHHLSE